MEFWNDNTRKNEKCEFRKYVEVVLKKIKKKKTSSSSNEKFINEVHWNFPYIYIYKFPYIYI
jgi:hypothetical protein